MNETTRWLRYQRYLYLLAKVLLALLVLGAGWWIFGELRDILLNIGVSFLVAYLLNPLVDWLERLRINRTLAIFFLLVLGLGIATAFVLIVVPTITDDVRSVANDAIPRFIETARHRYDAASAWMLEHSGRGLPQSFDETFTHYGQRLQDLATELVQRLTSVTGDFLSAGWAVVAYIVNICLIPLFIFYYLRDFERIKARLTSMVPLPYRPAVLKKAQRIDRLVGEWFRGQLMVCGILGALFALGLAILDVKLGILIGIVAGLLHIIPYLGFTVGLALALLMSALDSSTGWGQLFGVVAVFTLVQTLEAYIITPKIVGERVGLSPLMVIIVVLVGGQLFGFWGVLLAVPAAAVLRVFLLDAVADYKRSRLFLGEENFMKLLAQGPAGVDDEVRQALREAAEADLDMTLPAPITAQDREQPDG